jgi:hypothetical protein
MTTAIMIPPETRSSSSEVNSEVFAELIMGVLHFHMQNCKPMKLLGAVLAALAAH